MSNDHSQADIFLQAKPPGNLRLAVGFKTRMELTPNETKANALRRIGSQPVALAAAAFLVVVIGIGSIAFWRAYTGTSPQQERAASFRLMQTQATQATERLVEKTNGLEISQQESIDQLQAVQDQLQLLKRQLAAQQTETKRLNEQLGNLTGSIETLRQSFASAQPSETPVRVATRKRPTQLETHAINRHRGVGHRKRDKSRS